LQVGDASSAGAGPLARLSQPLQLLTASFLPLDEVADFGLVSKSSRQLSEAFVAALKHFDLDSVDWDHYSAFTMLMRFSANLQSLSGLIEDARTSFASFKRLYEQYKLPRIDGGSFIRPWYLHLVSRNARTLRRLPDQLLTYHDFIDLLQKAVPRGLPSLEAIPLRWTDLDDGDDTPYELFLQEQRSRVQGLVDLAKLCPALTSLSVHCDSQKPEFITQLASGKPFGCVRLLCAAPWPQLRGRPGVLSGSRSLDSFCEFCSAPSALPAT
jgi:hypothetical protein